MGLGELGKTIKSKRSRNEEALGIDVEEEGFVPDAGFGGTRGGLDPRVYFFLFNHFFFLFLRDSIT